MLKRLADADLSVSVDDERIIREVALFADKCDISEEITRLSSHFDQFRTLCGSSLPRAGLWISFARKSSGIQHHRLQGERFHAGPSGCGCQDGAGENQGTGSEHRMTAMKQPLGTLLVVSGPSGSGKTTLCRRAQTVCVYSISARRASPDPGSQWSRLPFPDSARLTPGWAETFWNMRRCTATATVR